MSEATTENENTRHFIQEAIDVEVSSGRWGAPGDRSVVHTRFPPEPNGYMHIGHAKAICINFGLAQEYGGTFNLRFDDTNPETEETRFVDAIVEDIQWLGCAWPDMRAGDSASGVFFASDYFPRMHELALDLIDKGLAYVDDQTPEQIRATRGGVGEAGTTSPWRDRTPEENRALFEEMVAGSCGDGQRVLRAKIDMASPNMNLRDPVMYRVQNATHHRTGDRWQVYPMYDWAHGLEDSIEGITHSLCSLEFEDHRPLYDWFIDAINEDRPKPIVHSRQMEFARLNPTFTVTSKRRLRQLVEEGHVDGWDDPRMPTLSGLRRRGYTPESITAFCADVGVTKFNATHDIGLLENALRSDLNVRAPRRMCVLDPIKVTITNWGDGGEEDRVEWMEAVNNPGDEAAGTRLVPFTKVLLIERNDFMEDPPKKYFRLRPGGEVRLRYGFWITCNELIKSDAGEVIELRCTYDPETRGGESPPPDAEGKVRKVKGTIHWVSEDHAVPCEVRLFDRLYSEPTPGKRTGNHLDDLNPDALKVIDGAMIEPNWSTEDIVDWPDGIERVQFERTGYFCVERQSEDGTLVWNRTVPLRDSWRG
jgi:glutaminyl-tRNA synthetase